VCLAVDKLSQIEDSEIIPYSYSYLIFNKAPKTYVCKKKASSTNGVLKIEYLHKEY
jgi:hypothetical protein